ncbi:PucR family transcriptional regulator [Streptomyces sp. NRRL F-5126]|uniref:PucR family transcriptional regulator n=1 Tax=Streptomyces sp. NRRL F-5126 TaxID=1463857 RepID=UPI00099E0E39|nr:helix-turn-helix domain-containing protein [Streptomyces sp. NRRL F-5126]
MGEAPRGTDAGTYPRSGTARAEDALALVRLAGGARPVAALVDWLARRAGGTAAVVTGEGAVVAAAPGSPAQDTVAAVGDLYRRGMPSGVTGTDRQHTVHMAAVGSGAYLVLHGRDGFRHGTLLADAAPLVELALRSDECARDRRRMADVRAHGREAVLHLLVAGSVTLAHRVAGAMGDILPGPLRVCVVESSGLDRAAAGERLERTAGGVAWVVPCPVRSRHLIALVPADVPSWEDAVLDEIPGCRIGVSADVPLRDTALGYEQAFHALAVARRAPGRWSRFGRHDGLAPLLGDEGARWAAQLLRPVLAHQPGRSSDPGPEELLATLASWLTFGAGAVQHLKIHRNTLTARLRLVQELLGLDLLRGVGPRSAVWLALRLRAPHTPPAPGRLADLDALLAAPATLTWARARVAPLTPACRDAVRAWLRADTRLAAGAASLGLSPPGLRKRLVRAEEATGRSLLDAPSATYELWLALTALGLL